MRRGSARAGVFPAAQNVDRSGLRSQGHGVQHQQRAPVGDAVQQRQPLRTAVQEFHLVTPLGGIPLQLGEHQKARAVVPQQAVAHP